MSGGQGYIGSKISLISRSDIRYVGVLHSINSEDSTVALEHVHSFGTEGRRGNPSEEIPPSENVFEFIVFRGSDIKDLQVFEPPAPKQNAPPPQQYPNDPAIMSSSMENYTSKQPTAPATYQQAPYYSQTTSVALQQQASDNLVTVAKQEPLATEPVNAAPVEVAPQTQAPAPTTSNAARAEVTSTDVEQLAKSVSGMNVTATEKPATAAHPNKLPGTGEHLIRSNNRGNRNSRVNVRYSAHSNPATNATNRMYVPKSDFDFEQSNAKFNKDSVVKEVVHQHEDEHVDHAEHQDEEEVVIPPADDYYNRSKSFFDNISCEAKERQEHGNSKYGDNRRSKFHEERKLNVETFGQASVDQGRHRGYRGRGGHHHRGGRGGRGGYRGRGNYNSNRQQQQQQQSTTA